MLLYTERQLKLAYEKYIQNLITTNRQGIEIPLPGLEEFRDIFEAEWTQRYKEMDNGL
jgi:hypothetical protein